MTVNKYPEEIYPKRKTEKTAFGIMESWHSTNLDYERAYDLGFRDGRFKERLEASNPLAGWSNLTEAIQAGERIDWAKLDGLEAKCVHPQLGTLTHKLVRDQPEPPNSWAGWGDTDSAISHWDTVFECAWLGSSGWALYIKGDLPLRKLTADQLESGTIFEAVLTDEKEFGPATLLRVDAGIIDVEDWQMLDVDLTCIEVSRVLGTFQTPKENA